MAGWRERQRVGTKREEGRRGGRQHEAGGCPDELPPPGNRAWEALDVGKNGLHLLSPAVQGI